MICQIFIVKIHAKFKIVWVFNNKRFHAEDAEEKSLQRKIHIKNIAKKIPQRPLLLCVPCVKR